MTLISQITAVPDYAAIKSKQNASWASGDYARIGATLHIVGETLAEAMDLSPDSEVLDVAAGNGNATLAFARRWCRVTSTDYVGKLLSRGRARSEAESLDVTYQVADAEHLPFESGSFDAVVSTFGAMFAPNQLKVASEMLRVCRPGGSIGMANWTPEGFVGQLFKTLGKHVAPPHGVNSPAAWGRKAWIDEVFADKARSIAFDIRAFVFRYHSPEHFVDFFRTYYGPVHKAFLALDADGQQALAANYMPRSRNSTRPRMARCGFLRTMPRSSSSRPDGAHAERRLGKAPKEIAMALELRPNCECCDRDLPPASTLARICSYECTFCADCVEHVLANVCPNCGGGFAPRPIRPATEWRPGLSIAKRPPSNNRVGTSFTLEEIAAHSNLIKDVRPNER